MNEIEKSLTCTAVLMLLTLIADSFNYSPEAKLFLNVLLLISSSISLCLTVPTFQVNLTKIQKKNGE